MAIVYAFKYWYPKLKRSANLIKVITNYKKLEYCITTK